MQTLKKQIIEELMKNDILVTETIISRLDALDNVQNIELIDNLKQNKKLIMDDSFFSKLTQNIIEQSNEENNINNEEQLKSCPNPQKNNDVKIVFNYDTEGRKRQVKDFVSYFKRRYYSIMKILSGRQELNGVVSISRLFTKEESEYVAVIGMISEINRTAKGNLIIKLEDDTGIINLIVTQNNKDCFEVANELVLDEVIGVTGTLGDKVLFGNSIILPDVPMSKELKKSPKDEYALFIGDLHFGSKYFLTKQWKKFISWIKGEIGSDKQKSLVKKIKYLIIAGDIVEGVGIYPGQENDLDIKDIYEQYLAFSFYMKQIPSHINIIITPGNHDAVRIADPQPPIPKKYLGELCDMPNVFNLSSPSYINIGASNGFSGLDILIDHGFSFPYYADNIVSIRDNGGMERADLVLKFYLQRRHLGPTHGSLQYIPESHFDPLHISKIPDVLVTGHIHRASASVYRNVSLFNCSTWIGMTDYQEKVGLEPEPARAILMSLKTRNMKILNFNDKEDK